VKQSSRSEFHISFLLSTQFYTLLDEKTKEVTQMQFKAVLLLFLLFFAAIGTIALVNLSAHAIAPKNLKTATFALGLGIVQPAGGEPIDNPCPH
jgi:hypothetical protein